jgi:transcriptional regulator with XRE-family HTH domain
MSAMNPENFRRNLVAIRKQLGFTQPEFAEAVGISVDTIRSWEKGRRLEVKLSNAMALVEYLGIDRIEDLHKPEPPAIDAMPFVVKVRVLGEAPPDFVVALREFLAAYNKRSKRSVVRRFDFTMKADEAGHSKILTILSKPR